MSPSKPKTCFTVKRQRRRVPKLFLFGAILTVASLTAVAVPGRPLFGYADSVAPYIAESARVFLLALAEHVPSRSEGRKSVQSSPSPPTMSNLPLPQEPYRRLVVRDTPLAAMTVTAILPTEESDLYNESVLRVAYDELVFFPNDGTRSHVVLDSLLGVTETSFDSRGMPLSKDSLPIRLVGTLPLAPWGVCRVPTKNVDGSHTTRSAVRCGLWARDAMRKAFAATLDWVAADSERRRLRCVLYGRGASASPLETERPFVARCGAMTLDPPTVAWDLGERLVAAGVLRIFYPDSSAMLRAEQEAVNARRGLWAMDHVFPQINRAVYPLPAYDADGVLATWSERYR